MSRDGDGRKVHAVGLAGFRAGRKRTGRPVAAAQHVGTDHEELVRVNRLAGANVEIPPAGTPGFRVKAGDMRRARQGVADQDGVVAPGRERPQRLIRHLHLIERETGLDLHSAQRDGLGARHAQGRLIAGDLLILKIALDDAGGASFIGSNSCPVHVLPAQSISRRAGPGQCPP